MRKSLFGMCSKSGSVGCVIDEKGMGKPTKVDFGGNTDMPFYGVSFL